MPIRMMHVAIIIRFIEQLFRLRSNDYMKDYSIQNRVSLQYQFVYRGIGKRLPLDVHILDRKLFLSEKVSGRGRDLAPLNVFQQVIL